MKKLLYKYKNGNYNVSIYSDGTKVRETEADGFIASFPENIDLKISNKCDLGCPFCHENSTINGKNAHFNYEFLNTLRSGTELAIGGGNIFENDQLEDFLKFCKKRGIIANLTINQSHLTDDRYKDTFLAKFDTIIKNNLVNGVGISYNGDADSLIKIHEKYKNYSQNFVIHVINGVHSYNEIMKLANKNYKILILGYKEVRRGVDFKTQFDEKLSLTKHELHDKIYNITKGFKVVSFDNLALEQLNIRRFFTKEKWDEFYMGNDGQHTMYIDLVEEEFSMNSTDTNNRYKLLQTIDEMFKTIKEDK